MHEIHQRDNFNKIYAAMEPKHMLAIISLFLVLALSLLITRIATVALTYTGLSRDAARFQARSAFTGSGFTTNESEKVVVHPVRRRIVMLLMLLGNAGIITAVSSLILTFIGHQGEMSMNMKIIILVSGIVMLWGLSVSHWVDSQLSHLIELALKRFTRLDVRDYVSLLRLSGEYRVSELLVQQTDWLANKPLHELNLPEEGILVLGIEKPDGMFLGAPDGSTELKSGDSVLLYGRASQFQDLDERRRDKQGQLQHNKSASKQKQIRKEEKQMESG
jgi:hypothetical protein